MEEELTRWEEERKAKQSASARQTGELISKIASLRETLGLFADEGDSPADKYGKSDLVSPASVETDLKGSLQKILEGSQSQERTIEGQIPIAEHEAIVRDEMSRMEQHYKSMLTQAQLEYEKRINLLQYEQQDKLASLERSIEERDLNLHKCIEEVICLQKC